MSTNGPRILILDIEISPNVAYTWGIYNQNIGLPQLLDQGRILCFAAKWAGERKVIFRSEFHDSREEMLDELWDLLDEAHAVVGYNSAAFDVKWINTEFLKEGLMPPSPYHHIDLLKTVRQNFKHPMNKLDYISQRLDIGSKVKHYGFELWRDVMGGDAKAWAVMKRYNKKDVALTEDLYKRLLPWIDSKFNYGLHVDAEVPTCRVCGSQSLTQIEDYYTKTQTYDQYRCDDCGKCQRERKRNRAPDDGVLTGV